VIAPQLPPPPQADALRLVMVGDIVGKPGLRIACNAVKWLRHEVRADAIVVNAENAADGSGLRCKDYRRLIESGIDGITMGDHVFKKREIVEVLETSSNIIRPANLPLQAPGKSCMVLEVRDKIPLLVTCVLGRVFMKPVDCPFRAVDQILATHAQAHPTHCLRVVEFHAEATSDKQLMGRYLDGRVSAVLGTHTHVATADEQILPGGTAFQCDLGMTGPFESILGRKIDAVMEATLHGVPLPFQVATEDVRLSGTWLDLDLDSGRCLRLGRLVLTQQTLADYEQEIALRRRVL
jgi:metallophosphoesterase (TIGR00282 family)